MYLLTYYHRISLHISADHETPQSQIIWQVLSDCLQVDTKQFK